jgi:hypothetical protein
MNDSLKNRKPTEELEIAIERDFIRKFWINCKNKFYKRRFLNRLL